MSSEQRLLWFFRVLVVASPLIATLGILYTSFAHSAFPSEWQEAIALSGHGGVVPMEEDEVSAGTAFFAVQLVGFAFLAIANQVALFFFWAPSRHIYLILCLVAFAIIPLLGLVVQPPLESLAYDLSLFLSGIILALCYFSPLSQRFKAASLEQLP